jgi:hypothetical protein
MVDILRGFFTYWSEVFDLIRAALIPRPELYGYILEKESSVALIAVGVAFVAGVSLLLGQSVILFLNRVGPLRFALSLLLHGLALVLGLLVIVGVIWVVGRLLFDDEPSLRQLLPLVATSYAPLAFGFLILIPYFGALIEKALYAWSALILLVVVRFGFEASLFEALLCVGLAYLLRQLLGATIGRPLAALRRRVRRRVIGEDEYSLTPAEIRARVLAGLGDPNGGDQ